MTPPQGLSTSPQIPNNTTSERSPMITTVFAATTPKNTPFAYRASTSTNPNPMISHAFVEANYEFLESILRERRRQIRNEKESWDLRKHRIRKEAGEEGTSEIKAENRGVNLPPLLAAHLGRNESGQPLRSSLTSVQGGHQPSTNMGGISPLMAQIGNLTTRGISTYHPQGGICHRPSPTIAYLHIMGLCSFTDSTRGPRKFLTPFRRGHPHTKMVNAHSLPHVHIHPQRFRPHMVEESEIGSILNYEDLKAKFRSHFSQQKKFTKTYLAVHNIKQIEGESTRAFITRYTDDTLQILDLHEEQRISGFVHGLRTISLVEHLSSELPTTYKGLMEKTYTWIEAR
ncbi:hypothetical protein Tco_0513531 [Tanacetum coccineum]